MNLTRRDAVRVLLGSALAASVPSLVRAAASDVVRIEPPQPTDSPGKIEVLEFFSYGCPHCAEFYAPFSAWIARQAPDIAVRKVPITFGRAAWVNLARLYYTLEITGDIAKLDGEVFKAVHVERINLFDDKTVNEWAGKKGVDPKKFNEAFNSFGVQSRVKRGDQMAQTYRIQGVPALAIDGRFLIGEQHLANADRLIAQIRSEKKK